MKYAFFTLAAVLLIAGQSLAATSYWDSNGATLGTAATPTGTWGTSAFWSADPNGGAATAAWTAGDAAVFSAGNEASGAWTLTVSGTQTAASVLVEEGLITQSGGTVDTGAGTFTIKNGASWTVS